MIMPNSFITPAAKIMLGTIQERKRRRGHAYDDEKSRYLENFFDRA